MVKKNAEQGRLDSRFLFENFKKGKKREDTDMIRMKEYILKLLQTKDIKVDY